MNAVEAAAILAVAKDHPRIGAYVQLAADDASFATGNIYGSGGGNGQP